MTCASNMWTVCVSTACQLVTYAHCTFKIAVPVMDGAGILKQSVKELSA